MKLLAQLRSWVTSVLRRSALERDMDAELQFHLESRVADLQARGMSTEDALRQARLDFGGAESHKDEMRVSLGLRWWDELRGDLRFAFRMVVKNPGFTAAAVLTLALGIGTNTAIFIVVNSTLIRPLPYANANRLVMIWESRPKDGNKPNVTSPASFLTWQDRNKAFERIAAIFNGSSVLTGGDMPEQVPVQLVTPDFFSVLGAEAAIGRVFNPQQEKTGADDVVLLSYDFWQRRFAGNPNVLGSKIMLDGSPQTVVGVMPRGFQFFVQESSFVQEKPQMWSPMTFDNTARSHGGRYLQSVGLLRRGVTLAQAQAEMTALAAQMEREDPATMKDWTVKLVPLHQQFVGVVEPGLRLMLAAVALVLLIACANVATLFLARAMARKHEIAVRVALGAATRRVVRQILTESCLLAAMGGVCGFVLALWATHVLASFAPPDLVPLAGVHLDTRVLAFTTALVLLTGILFGIVPALQAARSAPREPLQEGRTVVGGTNHSRARNGFAMAQIALALILLTGSGLLIRSFMRLLAVDPGFRPDGILTARIQLPTAKYKDNGRKAQFFQELLERVRQLPGVRSASANSFLPFSGIIAGTGVEIEGRPKIPLAQQPVIDVALVEPQFFETIGIPLLKGRTFTEREGTELSHTVVISREMANKLWPNGEDPIGRRVIIHMKREDDASEVIGVVGDVKHAGFDAEVHPTAYWPYPELSFGFMTLIVRTDGDPRKLAPDIRRIVSTLDKDQPLTDIRTMDDMLAASTARTRFATILMAAFAGIALLLAMLGIYGVVTYNVAERTRELGIRLAFGASHARIEGMLLKQGMRLALWGTLIGAVASLLLTRLLTKLLFATNAYDPVTFATVALVLSATALIACLLAARRATSMDPMQALRCE